MALGLLWTRLLTCAYERLYTCNVFYCLVLVGLARSTA